MTSLIAQNDKESVCNARDPGLIPGSGRSPGEGNGNPLQYSCLGKPHDRGAWWATVHAVTKGWTKLSDSHFIFGCGVAKKVSQGNWNPGLHVGS